MHEATQERRKFHCTMGLESGKLQAYRSGLLSVNTAKNILRLRLQNMASDTSTKIPERLTGKVALVTASTEGIGFAIAKRLAQEGARVMVSSRKQHNVDRAVKELTDMNLDVRGMVCHVGKPKDRTNLLECTKQHFGGLDILVSNAAANPYFGPFLDTPEEMWDKIFDVNLKSAFFLVKEGVPYMEERGGGAVLFISSIAGFLPFELLGAYSISKTTLLGLCKALAPTLASSGIRVNCVAPGLVKTKFSKALTSSEEAMQVALKDCALQRPGLADEIASAAAFLVSNDASYITGENLVVAGGQSARL